MDLKEKALEHCYTYVKIRLEGIKKEVAKINESLLSETKSTAGDKHETGRAMLQLEREKLGQQLAVTEKLKLVLAKISLDRLTERIALGSLVETTSFTYFLAISAGKIQLGAQEVFCISPGTPVGQQLLGKSKGDTFEFKGQKTTILDIF